MSYEADVLEVVGEASLREAGTKRLSPTTALNNPLTLWTAPQKASRSMRWRKT